MRFFAAIALSLTVIGCNEKKCPEPSSPPPTSTPPPSTSTKRDLPIDARCWVSTGFLTVWVRLETTTRWTGELFSGPDKERIKKLQAPDGSIHDASALRMQCPIFARDHTCEVVTLDLSTWERGEGPMSPYELSVKSDYGDEKDSFARLHSSSTAKVTHATEKVVTIGGKEGDLWTVDLEEGRVRYAFDKTEPKIDVAIHVRGEGRCRPEAPGRQN